MKHLDQRSNVSSQQQNYVLQQQLMMRQGIKQQQPPQAYIPSSSQTMKNGHSQNMVYPLQSQKQPNNNLTSSYLSLESSDFKSMSSSIKPPINQNHPPPPSLSSKSNILSQTMNAHKPSLHQSINSSALAMKQPNHSMTLQQHQQPNNNKSIIPSLYGVFSNNSS